MQVGFDRAKGCMSGQQVKGSMRAGQAKRRVSRQGMGSQERRRCSNATTQTPYG